MVQSRLTSISARLDRISDGLCSVASCLLLVMVGLINVEVLLRYGFQTSTLIADEYSGYLFVWLTLLGFAHALRSDAFIRVEVLVDRCGVRARAACEALSSIIGLLVVGVLAYAGWLHFAGSFHFGSRSIQPSSTPLWCVQIAVPLGLGWLCLLYTDALIRSFARWTRGTR